MEGVVVAVDTCLARGEVIPAIGKSYAVAVQQVEIQSHIRAGSRKHHAKTLVILKHRFDNVDVLGVIVHIGIARAQHSANQGQRKFAIERQQVVAATTDISEVIAQHPFGTKVDEARDACRRVHHRRNRFDVYVGLEGTARPEMEAVAFAVEETIKELSLTVDADRTTARRERGAEQSAFALDMAATPFDGDAPTKVATNTQVTKRDGAVVVAVGDGAASRKVEPYRHSALVNLPILRFVGRDQDRAAVAFKLGKRLRCHHKEAEK